MSSRVRRTSPIDKAVTLSIVARAEVKVSNARIDIGPLADKERAVLAAILRRLPETVSPEQLTFLGLIGAAVAAAGFVASRWSNWLLILAAFGVLANWLGDALSRELSSRLDIERSRYGYFIDHSTDLIAQTLVIVGLGLSPYFTIGSALLVLSLYLLVNSYAYLCVVTQGGRRAEYSDAGTTFIRLLVVGWTLIAAWAGPGIAREQFYSFAVLDIFVVSASLCVFVGFLFAVRSDLAHIRLQEIGEAESRGDMIGAGGRASPSKPARGEKSRVARREPDPWRD